jgi:hypothetical protein
LSDTRAPSTWFPRPVPVGDVRNVGRTINVSNIGLAMEVLLSWPDHTRPKWRRAAQTCIEAGEGKKTAADVRKAFEAAAKEAGMLRRG